ncbi:MAG: tRNA lysidine(34) synthetase TilS, partial [Alphaproteobacteria bacterium]|nr:tRNA lysidine(34) synthetase TilS [Alphaproteobacteria bacterium]
MSITLGNFEETLEALGVGGAGPIAVAVSGGPDSMALCWLLSRWAVERGVKIHVLTVDHGLRPEAAEEAIQVGAWLGGWSQQVEHHILRWKTPADTAIQEEARKARYGLMAEYCRVHDIRHLFLAHHRDDQAET